MAASNPVTAAVLAVLAIDAATGGTIGAGIQHAWDAVTGGGNYVQSNGYSAQRYDKFGTTMGNNSTDYGHGFNPQNMIVTKTAEDFVNNMEMWYLDMADALGIERNVTEFGYSLNSTGSAVIVGGLFNKDLYISPEVMPDAYNDAARHAIHQALLQSATSQAQVSALQGLFPGFALGGDFMGGMRLVGERGPELELTGPSRIFDAATTASMLRSGGASNDEVIAELRLLRDSLERSNEYASRTADAVQGRSQGAPILVQVVTG